MTNQSAPILNELVGSLLDQYVDGDPRDHFPWYWMALVDGDGNRGDVGFICTPNGRRPDGEMHTYWSVAHEVWLLPGIIHLRDDQRRRTRTLRHPDPPVGGADLMSEPAIYGAGSAEGERAELREWTRRRMKEPGIPSGTDNPTLPALGVKPLRAVDDV